MAALRRRRTVPFLVRMLKKIGFWGKPASTKPHPMGTMNMFGISQIAGYHFTHRYIQQRTLPGLFTVMLIHKHFVLTYRGNRNPPTKTGRSNSNREYRLFVSARRLFLQHDG